LHASEREREDIKQARQQWHREQPWLDVTKLVFIDETGVSTNMTRLYGRAPKGERVHDAAPHGHWHTNTFIGALRHDGITAPLLLDGPMNGDCFVQYVKQVLCPTLGKGDIVIADNLSSHKVKGVKEAIAASGAKIVYLPAYSPDLNPIENFFSKLKSLLRKAGERSFEGLVEAISQILDTVSQTECSNYFSAAGYVYT